MLSEKELQTLRNGLLSASPGPWRMIPYERRWLIIGGGQPWPPVASVEHQVDAAFIVQAHRQLAGFLLLEESLKEIAAAVAVSDPVVWNDGEPHCLFECAGHVDVTSIGTPYYAHAPSCAYVKSLELTDDVGDEDVEDRAEPTPT